MIDPTLPALFATHMAETFPGAEFFDIVAADGTRYTGSTVSDPPPQPKDGDRRLYVDFRPDAAGLPLHRVECFTAGAWGPA